MKKETVFNILGQMPEEIDADELIERITLWEVLERAEEDIREGRLIPHEEIVRETDEWFK